MKASTEPIRNAFVWQVRVYWEDTDAGGVVYHSQYLNFFERARTEWLRSRGIDQSVLAKTEGIVFAVRRMEVDWLGPAKLDDVLEVTVHSINAGRSRLCLRQDMRRSGQCELLASARVTAACIDAEAFKPKRIPDSIRTEIKNDE